MECEESAFLNNSLLSEENEDELMLKEVVPKKVEEGELDSDTSKNPMNNTNSPSAEHIIKNNTWKLGQLAWARMSIYPFWPCMITNDPNSLLTYQKVSTVGKSKTLMIHVHFFNDHGRHSWIPAYHMLPFHGIEDFRKRASLVTDLIRKKEPKFAAALHIKPNTFATWQKAVAEAMDVLYELDTSALENFKSKPKEVTSSTTKATGTSRKRKLKEDDSKIARKIFKSADPTTEDNLNTEKGTDVTNSINLETPPVSPQDSVTVQDDLRAATFKKQKRITRMINKLQPPDFEVYFERNFYTIKEQHSDTTDEQVREYLYDVWESMAPEEKLKYRATYKIEMDS